MDVQGEVEIEKGHKEVSGEMDMIFIVKGYVAIMIFLFCISDALTSWGLFWGYVMQLARVSLLHADSQSIPHTPNHLLHQAPTVRTTMSLPFLPHNQAPLNWGCPRTTEVPKAQCAKATEIIPHPVSSIPPPRNHNKGSTHILKTFAFL